MTYTLPVRTSIPFPRELLMLAETATVASPSIVERNVPPCLYCGSSDYEPLYENVTDRLGYAPGKWAFVRCRQCGSAILSPFPTASDLAAFYPPLYSFTFELGRASAFHRFLTRLEYLCYFRPQYAAQVRRVLKGIGWTGTPGQKILDVGCGRGLRLLEFRRRGFDVQGMDFQPAVIEYLRNELNIPAVCADVDGLPAAFAPASFDIITAFFLLEHVPDVGSVLRNCFSLLKPGGWFIGAVPMIDSVQAGLFKSKWLNVTEAPRHLSLPTRRGITDLCRDIGYHSVDISPDSSFTSAGQIGLSLFPNAAITHAYGGSRLKPLLLRGLGALVTLLSVPFCFYENNIAKRPSIGMVFARKPF
jgi:SAM-dependent methyltransferase